MTIFCSTQCNAAWITKLNSVYLAHEQFLHLQSMIPEQFVTPPLYNYATNGIMQTDASFNDENNETQYDICIYSSQYYDIELRLSRNEHVIST